MVKDAYVFLVPILLLAAGCFVLGWTMAGLPLVFLAGFVAYFFRNPERSVPDDPAALVSPADGKIVQLREVEGGTLLSIFLSVFDVHVNRAPMSGKISRCAHQSGKFLLAFDDRASVENEQLQMEIQGSDRRVRFSLIAGLVARRIVPWVGVGDMVSIGDRIALIRFGSRVDLLIPEGCRVLVGRGERVKAGTTILGRWEQES